ncbi:MAG: phosphatase PAP2 family protein, partial [Bacillota bacterium]
EVRVILPETGGGYGFPSGHAQEAMVFWGYLARTLRVRKFTVAAIVIVFLIGLSRVYLGVHFPGDVVGGFLIGGIILMAYLWVTGRLELWGKSLPTGWLLFLVAVAPFVLLVFYRSAGAFKMVGLLVGLGVGCVLEDLHVRMNERAPLRLQVLKAIIGLVVVFGLRSGLKALFAPETMVLSMVRYAALSLWASLGAPFVFVRVLRVGRKD